MKRWLWYIGLAAAVAFLSGKQPAGKDIGKLQPVQAVRLTCAGEQVRMETDTGDFGEGENVQAALEDMKRSASGEIFLDTADYLIVSPDCLELMPSVASYLRPSCAVCVEDGEPDMGRIGSYLQNHTPDVTLKKYRAGLRDMQTLVTREGRMRLVS